MSAIEVPRSLNGNGIQKNGKSVESANPSVSPTGSPPRNNGVRKVYHNSEEVEDL